MTCACSVVLRYSIASAWRPAVNASAPWLMKWAVHSLSRLAVSPLQTFTWAASVVWCSWLRRTRRVVASATPTLPPTLRTTLQADGGKRERLERHKDEAHGEPLKEARPRETPVIHAECQPRHERRREGAQQAPASQHEPLINARHETSRDHERQHRAKPAGSQHEARVPRVVGQHLLRIQRDQQHARVEPEADESDADGPDCEVPVVEHAQVEDRLGRHQFADEEASQRTHGEDEQHHDEA